MVMLLGMMTVHQFTCMKEELPFPTLAFMALGRAYWSCERNCQSINHTVRFQKILESDLQILVTSRLDCSNY